MMKVVKIALIPVILILLIYLGFVLFSRDDVEDAIEHYDDQEYIEAIQILNDLMKVVDYEEGERVMYYRCRAINRLAAQLQEEYKEELEELSKEGIPEKEKREIQKSLELKLDDINRDIGGDLTLLLDKRGMIVSRGKFYDDFIARYKGSRLIEDLDYEELQKIARTERHKLIDAVVNFHQRYPATPYISHLVKMLFHCFQKGDVQVKGNQDFLRKLILQFARRYPTSSEFYRIYTCDGEGVNMRNSPGIEGGVVSKAERGEILIQLEKSMDTFQVGDTRDYWYRVMRLSGHQGWIFGKFLKPLDLPRLEEEAVEEEWSLEEFFTDWRDSHTPKNWVHLENTDSSTISFVSKDGITVVRVHAPKGKASGLFRRSVSKGVFALETRARFVTGDAITIIAFVRYDGRLFYLKLLDEEIETSGRKIPLHTADWHVYRLESDDGKLARLSVDGEIISSRINPVVDARYITSGIICLSSSRESASLAEMEYVKIR